MRDINTKVVLRSGYFSTITTIDNRILQYKLVVDRCLPLAPARSSSVGCSQRRRRVIPRRCYVSRLIVRGCFSPCTTPQSPRIVCANSRARTTAVPTLLRLVFVTALRPASLTNRSCSLLTSYPSIPPSLHLFWALLACLSNGLSHLR